MYDSCVAIEAFAISIGDGVIRRWCLIEQYLTSQAYGVEWIRL